jgi:hypothetical protein
MDATMPKLSAYPADLIIHPGDKIYTPEDYPVLLEEYGPRLVVLGRSASEINGFVATTSLVKFGMFGRCMKPAPAGRALEFVPEDADTFAGRDSILVCTPPMDGSHAAALAEIAMADEAFFAMKVPYITALNSVMALDQDRALSVHTDMIRFLHASMASHYARTLEITPPTGDWNVYEPGGDIPSSDKLTSAIKGFASHSTRAYPPLPPLNDSEAAALLQIHGMLASIPDQGIPGTRSCKDLAKHLIQAALSSPLFVKLCHLSDIFSAECSPPIELNWLAFGNSMLELLLSEELTHAARRETHPERVTDKSSFIFTLKEVLALPVPHAPRSEEDAFNRLNTYVGGYLADLDLSRTLITGSAMAAALIVTDIESKIFNPDAKTVYRAKPKIMSSPGIADMIEAGLGIGDMFENNAPVEEGPVPEDPVAVPADEEDPAPPEDPVDEAALEDGEVRPTTEDERRKGYEAYLASHYPPANTVPRIRNDYMEVVKLKYCNPKSPMHFETVMENGKPVLRLTVTYLDRDEEIETAEVILDVKPGADVDMAVDVETNDEFDAVAQSHFRVISAKYPCATLRKIIRDDPNDPRYNWLIACQCLCDISTFRQVEIYRANFNHVITHHVGMVSGAYTGVFSNGRPQFVMSSRLVSSMANLATPNYYYFASRKTPPQYIIMKYHMRGFMYSAFPPGIQRAISATMANDPRWSETIGFGFKGEFPAMFGKGFFSAYSLPSELQFGRVYPAGAFC